MDQVETRHCREIQIKLYIFELRHQDDGFIDEPKNHFLEGWDHWDAMDVF